jgi:hypothetical protein
LVEVVPSIRNLSQPYPEENFYVEIISQKGLPERKHHIGM